MAKCLGNRKKGWGVSATLTLCNTQSSLPVMHVGINGVMCSILIYSGCTRSLVKSSVCSSWDGQKMDVLTINGKSMASRGVSSVTLQVGERIFVVVEMLAMNGNLSGFHVLLGLDVIHLFGVHINERGEVNFLSKVPTIQCCCCNKN